MADEQTRDSPGDDSTLSHDGNGPPPAGPTDGVLPCDRFGEYELLGELGRGGMGVVFRARQASLNRTVALKMILSGQFASEEELERFYAEAEAAAQLSHPGIVPVYEVGREGSLHYYSMGYVEGVSLSQRLREGPMAPAIAARLVQQVAEAVHHAHQRGIIHRDLKPGNILLDAAGLPHVTDFGLAKLVASDSQRTATGQILGTPSYMPPEQASGDVRRIDIRSDVYSLGAVLYAALAARPPFQADTPAKTLWQVIHESPVSPRRLNAEVPRDLETICLKCLEKEPDKRYADAGALAEDVGRFLKHEPIVARPIGGVGRLWRWCKRKPVVAGLTAALALLLVFLAVAGPIVAAREMRLASDEKQARLAAEALRKEEYRRLFVAHMNLAQQAAESGDASQVRELLARHLPQEGREDRRGFGWFYLKNLVNQHVKSWGDEQIRLSSLEYTPDGKTLITGGSDGLIRLWDAASGRLQETLRGHGEIVMSLAISPDGKQLASGGHGFVKLWDLTTGEIADSLTMRHDCLGLAYSRDGRLLAATGPAGVYFWNFDAPDQLDRPGPAETMQGLAFSPREDTLAFGSHDGTIWLWTTDGTNTRRFEAHDGRPVMALAFSPDGKTLASAGGHLGSFYSPSANAELKLWDVATLKLKSELVGHRRQVICVRYSPDGKTLATGSGDCTINLWDAGTGLPTATLLGHSDAVYAVRFSRDGKHLASTGVDGTIKLWDPAGLRARSTIRGHDRAVRDIALSPNGQVLITTNREKSWVLLWDVAGAEQVGQLQMPMSQGGPRGVAFAAKGQLLAVAHRSGVVSLWDVETRTQQRVLAVPPSLRDPEDLASAVLVSPDGRFLASAGGDGRIHLWDVATRKPVDLLRVPGRVGDIAFSPQTGALAIVSAMEQRKGSYVGELRLWDPRLDRTQVLDRAADLSSFFVAFSPDSTTVAYGVGRIVRLWNIAQARAVADLRGHTDWITSLAFCPDGKTLASGSADGTIRLWDLATRESKMTLLGHTAAVIALDFSTNGRVLASSSQDTTVRLWRAAAR